MATNKTLSELVRQLQGGYDVFQELWEHPWVQNMVKRECRRLWGTPAEEVEQACRVALWGLTKTCKTDAEAMTLRYLNVHLSFKVDRWLKTTNKCPQVYLSARGEESASTLNDVLTTEQYCDHGFTDILENRLTPAEKRVALFLIDGYSKNDIAKKLGVSNANISQLCKRIKTQCEMLLNFPGFAGISVRSDDGATNLRRILADRCSLSNDLKVEQLMCEQSAIISALSRCKTEEDMANVLKSLQTFTAHYDSFLWELFGADRSEWTRADNIAA